MIRRILFFIVLCHAAWNSAQAQDVDPKVRINEIKRDSSYLYGEATMASQQEAVELAKDFLRSYIEQWVAQTRDTRQMRSIVVKDIVADCEQLSLMRGNMYRAFAYVRKDDLYAVDGNATTIAVTTQQPAQESPQATLAEEVAEVTDTAAVATETVAPDTAEAPAETDAPQATETITQPDGMNLIKMFCEKRSLPEIRQLLADQSSFGTNLKCGSIDRTTDPLLLEKAYLVIYKSADQSIAAILSPKNPKRTNIATGKEDSTVNYPGCQAMWIQ